MIAWANRGTRWRAEREAADARTAPVVVRALAVTVARLLAPRKR